MKNVILNETPNQRIQRKMGKTDAEMFWLIADLGKNYLDNRKWPTQVAEHMNKDQRFWRWFRALLAMFSEKLDAQTAKLNKFPEAAWWDYMSTKINTYQVNESILKVMDTDGFEMWEKRTKKSLIDIEPEQVSDDAEQQSNAREIGAAYPIKNAMSDIYWLIKDYGKRRLAIENIYGFDSKRADEKYQDVALLMSSISDKPCHIQFPTFTDWSTIMNLCVTYLGYDRIKSELQYLHGPKLENHFRICRDANPGFNSGEPQPL
jgi:hypothetical protein